MALYFISAASGTGKTTLMRELHNRGIEAHDTDAECIRRSRLTGEALTYEQAKNEGGYDWIYPTAALKKLKSQSNNKDIYLLGNVDNLDELKADADEFIWMDIPLDVLNERLDKRTKEYGKTASERKLILSVYEKFRSTVEPEIFTLDATKSVEHIADDLLEHTK
jgi:gluconate kinase